MKRYQPIGQGRQNYYPYEVAVQWADPDSPSETPRPIALSEGSGHSGAGGCFKLADVLDSTWTQHLELCDCLWLRDLAAQEQARGRLFSADEIFALWLSRSRESHPKTP